MDRLHAVAIPLLLLAAAGCDDKAHAKAPVAKGRVNAVVAKKVEAEKPADFCDVYHADAADAVDFNYPELDGEAPPSGAGWRWVNLWASWCEPCVEEMPRLSGWEKELASKGLGDVAFVSADATAEAVAKFRTEHPEMPDGPRLADPEQLQPWLNGLGLAGSPSLPVHVFVDGAGKARCIRMGGVSDHDRAAVERLLGG